MNCPRIPIFETCIVGAVIGGFIYALAARRKKTFVPFVLLEGMTQGFLLAGAFHLMFCVFCPEQLVEIVDAKGQPVHLKDVNFKIDTLHSVEILLSSVMLAVTGIMALKSVWDKPSH
jgi:hypothetical protein